MHTSLLVTLLIVGLFLAALWAGTRLMIEVLGWVFRGFRPKRPYYTRGGSAGMICPNRRQHATCLAGRNRIPGRGRIEL